jgi:transposase
MVAWEPWRLAEEFFERALRLLPVLEREPGRAGRPRVEHRVCLEAILYVLFSGLPWASVSDRFAVSGVTCWRRLREWQQAGVWEQLLAELVAELERVGALEEARFVVDASIAPAKKGARRRGRARLIAAAPRASGI